MIEDRESQGGAEKENRQLEGTDVKVRCRSGALELRNKHIDMGLTGLMA